MSGGRPPAGGGRAIRGGRRAIAAAAVLSIVGLVGGIALAIVVGNPILAVFGVIVALAPWGAVIDQVEKLQDRDRDR